MEHNRTNLYPVILSGGAGTRLWPVSRQLHPKPFIRMVDGESLLQKAFNRASVLQDVTEIITVTNRDLFFITEDEYREVNLANLPLSFILEPFGRNTAPAIATATILAHEKNQDAVVLVLPSDHLISDQGAFTSAVNQAISLTENGKIVTFGIQPSRAETGYGYIEADGNKVKRFIEKPSLEDAERFLKEGHYLWNAGMFCFRADAMLHELSKYAADLMEASKKCIQTSHRSSGDNFNSIELESTCFQDVQDISIDYAVMEKSKNIAVVACDIGWNDIGSWNAFSDVESPDIKGNRVIGRAHLHNTTNCYIQSERRLVGAVGVNDLIIIDTPDAVLVSDREHAQDVRHIVGQLKEEGAEEHKFHSTVHRPWGTYTILEEGPRFKIKRIVVKAGASLSLQVHHHRSEHWVVVNGTAKVVNGDEAFIVVANEPTYIPAGHKHRLENPENEELVIIEVQCGDYLGEDDIARFDDKYGRK